MPKDPKSNFQLTAPQSAAAAFIFFAAIFLFVVLRKYWDIDTPLGLTVFLIIIISSICVLIYARSRAAKLEKEILTKLRIREESYELLENRLKKRSEETKALLASIGDGVVATDRSGKIIFLNKAATAMVQWEESEAVGKHFNELVSAEDESGQPVPEYERAIVKVLRVGERVKTIHRYTRKDGSKFVSASMASPVFFEGVLIGAILTFRDITRELEIDRSKTEFVSLASHQLRTPLATINWYSEILLSGDVGPLTKEQQKYLKEIYAANQRMTELINALLNVSRIELGTFVYNPEPVDLNAVVDGIVADLRLTINAKKIRFEREVLSGQRPINIDTHHLEVIIQNLLSNSIKYTPLGGLVRLTAVRDENELRLEIKDTGYGIPAGQKEHVFEKFFRADNVREMDTEGTGLGLYIVKALVERMGGEIKFESFENKGTTFYVRIPLAVSAEPKK